MKHLIDILIEMEGVATPGNTMGMGNPMAPTDSTPGTEPLIGTAKAKREKIKKDARKYKNV